MLQDGAAQGPGPARSRLRQGLGLLGLLGLGEMGLGEMGLGETSDGAAVGPASRGAENGAGVGVGVGVSVGVCAGAAGSNDKAKASSGGSPRRRAPMGGWSLQPQAQAQAQAQAEGRREGQGRGGGGCGGSNGAGGGVANAAAGIAAGIDAGIGTGIDAGIGGAGTDTGPAHIGADAALACRDPANGLGRFFAGRGCLLLLQRRQPLLLGQELCRPLGLLR